MSGLKKITREEFEADFQTVINDVLEHCDKFNLPQEQKEWFTHNLKANTIGGKYNRGMTVHDSIMLLTGAPLSPEAKLKANILGWCTELLQAFFLVSDDIMDSSKTRRGAPCWYLQDKVGMIAINDAFLLEACIYILLKKYFRDHPAYLDLIELFHDITFKTELGQLCDLLTADEKVINLGNFSLEKHSFIVIYKTAWYSFYLPVALALYQLNIATPDNLKSIKNVLIPLGEYFQIQDDYLDNFGDPEHMGKVGTDIQDNKCSWLINLALSKATPEQRALLDENYGRKDSAKEAVVKKIYDDMGLDAIYKDFEEERATIIRKHIAAVDESQGLKKSVLEVFLKKIYKRTK